MSNPIACIRLKNPWHLLATGFGSGLSPVIPGTMGTLAAIPFYLALSYLSLSLYFFVIVCSSLVGLIICQKTADDMGVHDHGAIVWDEFVGFWITMVAVQYSGGSSIGDWHWILAGFVLFRFFDMVKPWPISWLDRHVKGGLGIMLDDIVAGVIAGICLFLLMFFYA
ncbi:phosphatidylglycerophosphatase A [Vibrio quintilis]|uniref:Phosphatidylglycerophosphatase A n=1 Tax=Vibrio quintilis TaxID=1117707 RepID=A0A1M7Z0W9_9VIBR|nr:phosphatidylglycerophosphatase A [Vibrio quintilis]SHO58493.1 Phosphatidylglycerophosphatase A [Vibrio quintilis]